MNNSEYTHIEWEGFVHGEWEKSISVRDFIQKNYTPYEGSAEFLMGASERTKRLNAKLTELFKRERDNGGIIYVAEIKDTSITAISGEKPISAAFKYLAL